MNEAGKKAQLTDNALTVLKSRYLIKDELGHTTETPEALFARVAEAVAAAEKPSARARWEAEFLSLMLSLRFLPNSPTLMNAGKPNGQLSACFVLPIEDSLDGIFDTLKYAAKIHQSGGGTGFAFSRLRPKGSSVKTTHGAASGPISFMRIYDTATETIKQGGARRGANMAVLRIDHPDVIEFIDSKRDLKSVINFNISVGVTDEFMKAVETDGIWQFKDPRDGKAVGKGTRAREIFARMAQAAWECGDPGVVFLDRINRFNPTPQVDSMESTNPCGEQPLLPFESCNLGSLNLLAYATGDKKVDWNLLANDIATAVRFLDDVIDINHFPVAASQKITRRNRKIGLGVMGFADLLLKLGVRYDSGEGRECGEKLMSFIDRLAKRESAKLAKERGAFPNWKGSLWQSLGYPKLRNATVSTVAPTGTISMIAGCSSGIEPIFSGVFERNVLDGAKLKEVHPVVAEALKGATPSDDEIRRVFGSAWRTAQEIAVDDHVRMQAVFQRHSDSAVSKTINLPKSATVEDVADAYRLAYRLGCKGITVYRDQSRGAQVLERSPVPRQGETCPDC